MKKSIAMKKKMSAEKHTIFRKREMNQNFSISKKKKKTKCLHFKKLQKQSLV